MKVRCGVMHAFISRKVRLTGGRCRLRNPGEQLEHASCCKIFRPSDRELINVNYFPGTYRTVPGSLGGVTETNFQLTPWRWARNVELLSGVNIYTHRYFFIRTITLTLRYRRTNRRRRGANSPSKHSRPPPSHRLIGAQHRIPRMAVSRPERRTRSTNGWSNATRTSRIP